jgi:hypothetical protein
MVSRAIDVTMGLATHLWLHPHLQNPGSRVKQAQQHTFEFQFPLNSKLCQYETRTPKVKR